jgi:hypothetical protein
MKFGVEACDLRQLRMPRRNRLDTFDAARHVQRCKWNQIFQIGKQRGRDQLRRHMLCATMNDSMAHGVEARQLQALELIEQRVDGILRTSELAIRFGDRAAGAIANAHLAAARPNAIRTAFRYDRFSAAGDRVQRKLA